MLLLHSTARVLCFSNSCNLATRGWGAEAEEQARAEALAQLQQEQWAQMNCRMDPDDQQYIIGGQVCHLEISSHFSPLMMMINKHKYERSM